MPHRRAHRRARRPRIWLLVVFVIVVVVAVTAIVVGTGSSTKSTTPPKPTATIYHPCSSTPQTVQTYDFPVPAANPAPVDPLATVQAPGGGSFVDTVTGQPFVPRGAHYVRLSTVRLGRNETVCASSNFDIGTGLDAYNPHRAAMDLSQMNFIRLQRGLRRTECR